VNAAAAPVTTASSVAFPDALRTWTRVGLLSFGGPAGQIAVMHRILVEEKHWIGEERFLHALNFCMLLPGPEAQQLATYIGWLLHGTRGGLVAGTLFVLPGFLALMAFSIVYVLWGYHPIVEGLFLGLKAAVVALIIEALLRIGRRALRGRLALTLAVLAFLALFLLHVPFPLIVAAAGVFGYVWTRTGRRDFLFSAGAHGDAAARTDRIGETPLTSATPSWKRAATVLAIWLPLWFVPLGAVALLAGPHHVFTQVGAFFSKMAVVTFGGAYAVLAYVAQEAAQHYGWVTPAQMLDGLGLAETTPGPLIMVVQFVGFLGAYQTPGITHPLLAGIFAACLTVWVTFVPCFLWIFLGAPYVEALRQNQALSGALAAITAAVVGVIANLALWFALHALFSRVDSHALIGTLHIDVPALASVRWILVLLVGLALLLTFQLKWRITRTVAVCALLGMGFTQVVHAADAAPLVLATKVPLGDINGRIDHLAFDPTRQRVYVAELGNNSVGIVDLKTRRVLRTVTGFDEPQGIGYEPSTDTVYVANGGDGSVRLFRAEDFVSLGRIELGADADNVRIDRAARRVYVGYGGGALAVIDPATRKRIADIALRGHPESFQLEADGPRIFVNVPDTNQIAVVTRDSNKQVMSWPTANLHANYPLAIDAANGRVLAIFRHPARLQAFDLRAGKPLNGTAVCGDSDDAFVDAKRNRIYVICGEGYVDTLDSRSAAYTRVGRLTTSRGSRTGLFVPDLDTLLVAIRATGAEPAALWILRPSS
jgi:chromate transporter